LTLPSVEDEDEEPSRPVVGVKRSLGFSDCESVMKKSKVDEVMEKMNRNWMQSGTRSPRVDDTTSDGE
jgi:hypothetical protein